MGDYPVVEATLGDYLYSAFGKTVEEVEKLPVEEVEATLLGDYPVEEVEATLLGDYPVEEVEATFGDYLA